MVEMKGNVMKTIIAIILCIGLVFCFVACNTHASAAENTNEESAKSLPRMVKVVDGRPMDNMKIYVDTETRVMYAVYSSNCGATMTVMVDTLGNPLRWEGELK
jgi:hypothetical protein